ncbi:MAG: hypothetical protein K0S01_2453 [Herbinix sp.]|jgi:hypothetical protein|nr:hypothetical protein [Herbinix sp.]
MQARHICPEHLTGKVGKLQKGKIFNSSMQDLFFIYSMVSSMFATVWES